MRSVTVPEADLTGTARIREAAMERFAADGVAATSLRAVALLATVAIVAISKVESVAPPIPKRIDAHITKGSTAKAITWSRKGRKG